MNLLCSGVAFVVFLLGRDRLYEAFKVILGLHVLISSYFVSWKRAGSMNFYFRCFPLYYIMGR